MGRRILLVDDEVAVLLTLKAVLEISGFEVDTAASAREGKSKLHTHEYQMIITDMRMESEAAGAEVIQAARSATYHPAVALLTAFPVAEEDWQEMGADKLLVKPVHTRILLEQIETLLAVHEAKLARATGNVTKSAVAKKITPVKKAPIKKAIAKNRIKTPASRKSATKKSTAAKTVKVKKAAVKKAAVKATAKNKSKK